MARISMRSFCCLFLIAGLCLLSGPDIGHAGDKKDMGGWEPNSPYNKIYNASELDKFKAWVVKVKEIVPMPGMSPGVALYVRESKDEDDDLIEVHLCPVWYMGTKDIGIKRGDRVKIRGIWAEIKGKDVFMASKIKKGNFFALKVRLTKDGTPFWTMSPEQLAKEKEAAKSK
jgi:hypothetical protein